MSAAWLADRGHRTASFAYEELAVVVRDGLRDHLLPGAVPLLAAGLAEGFDGSPLAGTADPAAWWEAYLAQVVPPALTAFDTHGVVLEAHLQNTLVAVDASGSPVQALFRDAEGVKLLPDVPRAAGWERLVYCLIVNHLMEIAGAPPSGIAGTTLARRAPRTGPARPARDPRPARLADPAGQDQSAAAVDGRGRGGRALSAAAQSARRPLTRRIADRCPVRTPTATGPCRSPVSSSCRAVRDRHRSPGSRS